MDDNWAALTADQRFHPLFVDVLRQGGGRFDNPAHYSALYASITPQGAVGEVLGNLHTWLPDEITRPSEGRARCLIALDIPDAAPVVDLDDANTLAELTLKPSDVVRRSLVHTQPIALNLWESRGKRGAVGIRWWSWWRPEWTVVMLWSDEPGGPAVVGAAVASVEPLTADRDAVVQAAEELRRYIP